MNKFAVVENDVLKLPNGLVADRAYLEGQVKRICHYVAHVAFATKDGKSIAALIFPRKKLLSDPDYAKIPEEGCFCPRNLPELGKCLSGCIHTMNVTMKSGYAKLDAAVIIDAALSVQDGTLSAPNVVDERRVLAKYGSFLRNLYGGKEAVSLDYVNLKFGN